MGNNPLAIERLMYERWGGASMTENEIAKALAHIARRASWTFEVVAEASGYTSSYQGLEWRDCWGACLGWSLHCGGIAAVSTQRPEFGLPPEFHLTSTGPLFRALCIKRPRKRARKVTSFQPPVTQPPVARKAPYKQRFPIP